MRDRYKYNREIIILLLSIYIAFISIICTYSNLSQIQISFLISYIGFLFIWPIALLLSVDLPSNLTARLSVIGTFLVVAGCVPLSVGLANLSEFNRNNNIIPISTFSSLQNYIPDNFTKPLAGFQFESADYLRAYSYNEVIASNVYEDHMFRRYYARTTVVPLVSSISNFTQIRTFMPANFSSSLSVWLYYTSARQTYTCYESCWPSVKSIFGLNFGLAASYRTISDAERATFYRLVQTAESLSKNRIAGAVPADSSLILFLSIDDPNLEKYFAIKWLIGSSVIVIAGLITLLGSWYNYYQTEKQVDTIQAETIIKINDINAVEHDEKDETYNKSVENSNK